MIKSRRMVCIDILRMAMAVLIMMRHMITMGGCGFGGVTNDFVKAYTGIVMVCFFAISGFCLVKSTKRITDLSAFKRFYASRALRILPLYFFIEFYRLLVCGIYDGDFMDRLIIFPIRMLGIQINYSMDVYAGVNWFNSIILMCYFVFPLVYYLICTLSKRGTRILFWIVLIVLSYNRYLLDKVGEFDTYWNPFFRFLEFLLGVMTAVMTENYRSERKYPNPIQMICMIGIIAAYVKWIQMRNYGMYFFIVAVIAILSIPTVSKDAVVGKVISKLSSYSFDVYMLQDVLFSNLILQISARYSGDARIAFNIIAMILLIAIERGIIASVAKGFGRIKQQRRSLPA